MTDKQVLYALACALLELGAGSTSQIDKDEYLHMATVTVSVLEASYAVE
jgi:hypothetical protein